MLSDNKVIEIFYMADDFCNFFNETVKKHSIEDGKKQLTLFQSLTSSPVRTQDYKAGVPFHHTPAKQRQTIIEVLEERQNSVAPTAL